MGLNIAKSEHSKDTGTYSVYVLYKHTGTFYREHLYIHISSLHCMTESQLAVLAQHDAELVHYWLMWVTQHHSLGVWGHAPPGNFFPILGFVGEVDIIIIMISVRTLSIF